MVRLQRARLVSSEQTSFLARAPGWPPKDLPLSRVCRGQGPPRLFRRVGAMKNSRGEVVTELSNDLPKTLYPLLPPGIKVALELCLDCLSCVVNIPSQGTVSEKEQRHLPFEVGSGEGQWSSQGRLFRSAACSPELKSTKQKGLALSLALSSLKTECLHTPTDLSLA